ncbi:MAG: ATPase domain-containing protein [archaeon]
MVKRGHISKKGMNKLKKAKKVSLKNNKKQNKKAVKEVSDKLNLGIPGFDQMIEGGIPRGISILVCGGPGTGKTTFCLHLLNNLASRNEKCLYLSFEESEERLKEHMRKYGLKPDELEKKGTLMIKRMDPFLISRSIEGLLAEARGELLIKIDHIKELIPPGFTPSIIVLDSLSAISAAFIGKEDGYRVYIEQLFKVLEKLNVTSFLISEVQQTSERYSNSGVEEFLADAIISFYNLVQGGNRTSAMEIVKLRGAQHKKKIVPLDIIEGKGMEIYPSEDIFVEEIKAKP